jgi:hypothetical protein
VYFDAALAWLLYSFAEVEAAQAQYELRAMAPN